ncbi:hypothetical protein RvY_12451 [Ramazzottius varieornatus]|uniref:BACK domain-containing protein n=1 Tax=Ramazzottius varieornatus TaxID=947166 RepID=A0A1D1VJJ5_RAMVA|nr:hypothetical protein RvY_12451 [Ramazzottius varieornatus]
MPLLEAARRLGLSAVEEKGLDFLGILLADEQLMVTLQLAERDGLADLHREAYKCLAKNFYRQTKMVAFLEWDVEKVIRLLSSDYIIIETELHVFTVAMRWICYQRSERLRHFKRLMDTVRWMYLSTEELLSIPVAPKTVTILVWPSLSL